VSHVTARDLVLLGVLAALLRAWHLAAVAPDPLFSAVVGDSAVYVARARALLAGTRDPVFAFTPPLYPVLLAALFAVAGEALGLLRILQSISGVAATLAVAIAASRLFGRRAGIVAGLFLAASPVAIFFDGEILGASPVLGLIAIGVACAARSLAGGSWIWDALLGASLTAAAHGQPQAAAFLPGALWVAASGSARQRRVLAFASASLAVFALGTAVQWRASGERVLISAGGGVNLAIGNHPGAEGGFELPRGTGLEDTRRGLFPAATAVAAQVLGRSALTPNDVSRFWTDRTWHWMTSNPRAAIGLYLRKLLLALHHRELPNHYSLEYFARRSPVLRFSPARFGVLLPLGAIGLWLLARRKISARNWLVASLGLYWLVLALFFITDRYRLLAWPYLALLAGIGVEGAWRAWETRDRRAGIGMAAAALTALLLSFLPPAPRFSPGHMSLILSDVLAARGDAPGSRQALIAAAATGEIYEASHNLANSYFKEHRYAEAAAEYERALTIEPEAVETLYGLALTELERGRAPAALVVLARARALAPNDPRIADAIVRAQAAVALAEQEARAASAPPGVEPRAIAAGDSARALAQRDARRAIYAQALADARAGQRAAARAGFERVLALDPQDAGAHLNLALLAESEGNFAAAAASLRQAAELGAGANIEWLLCAGRVATKVGQRGEAESFFRQAQVIAPSDPRPAAGLRALAILGADSTTTRGAPPGAETPTPAPEGRASTNHR